MSIDVSGGSNNKKYLLSPYQLKLSLFTMALFGGSAATLRVKNSFHRDRNLGIDHQGKGIDLYTKGNKKEIIDIIQSNKIFKNRVLNKALVLTNIDELFNSEDEVNYKEGELKETTNLYKFDAINSIVFPERDSLVKEEMKESDHDLESKQDIVLGIETEKKNEEYNSEILLRDCITEAEKDFFSSNESNNLNTTFNQAKFNSSGEFEEVSSVRRFHTSAYRFYSKENLVNSDLSISPLALAFEQRQGQGVNNKDLTNSYAGNGVSGNTSLKKKDKDTPISMYLKEVKQIVLAALLAEEDDLKRREAQLKFEES